MYHVIYIPQQKGPRRQDEPKWEKRSDTLVKEEISQQPQQVVQREYCTYLCSQRQPQIEGRLLIMMKKKKHAIKKKTQQTDNKPRITERCAGGGGGWGNAGVRVAEQQVVFGLLATQTQKRRGSLLPAVAADAFSAAAILCYRKRTK